MLFFDRSHGKLDFSGIFSRSPHALLSLLKLFSSLIRYFFSVFAFFSRPKPVIS